MDKKRGAIVVGASLAALTAGFFLRRWYITHRKEHIDACLEGSWAATTEISQPYIVKGLSF